jgi:hypothetical protein
VEDQSQRKIGGARHLLFRQGNAGLEELRGSYANPEVQELRIGEKAHGTGNNRIEWKTTGTGHFQRTLTGPGDKVISIRSIEVTADGKTLSEAVETHREDGKITHSTVVYSRLAGSGQTLQGEWKPTSRKTDTPVTMILEPKGASLNASAPDNHMTITFDGKPTAVTGPAVISGTGVAGKMVDSNTIELANSRSGVATGSTAWKLSADGKTLTATNSFVGPNASPEPSVTVFRKH